MTRIDEELYQFSTYAQPIDLSFHQYLLLAQEPVLFHTGNAQQAEALIPQLKETLGNKEIAYVFVSHFEADECGGLSVVTKGYPKAKTICSEVTARQLTGFGYSNGIITKKPGEKLVTHDYELEFVAYPSEMHLWPGLLAMENRRGIFFSSDLMIRPGKAFGTIIESTWDSEINHILPNQVPDPKGLAQMKEDLAKFHPRLVAPGHGPCLRLARD